MTVAALASSPPPLPGFLNALSSPLQHFGVWAIGLLILLEDFGIPVPGETILIAGAVYAGAGRLNVVLVGVVAFIAAIIGDNIGFAIGHFGGRALALRWGKYVFLTEERLDKAEAFFNRRGAIVITFARFVEGLRQANGIIAGITGMHWLRFLIFNAIGAALWVGTWVSLGYLAGSHITTIYHYITLYSYYVLIALAVLLAAYITRRVLRRRRRLAAQTRESADTESADTESADRQPADTEPTATESDDSKPADIKAAETEPADSKPNATEAADIRAADTEALSPGLVALEGGQLTGRRVRDPEAALGQRWILGYRRRGAEHRARRGEHIGQGLPVQAHDGRTAISHEIGKQTPERITRTRWVGRKTCVAAARGK
jgi:membrane protein DedA with SNARE-associated domain